MLKFRTLAWVVAAAVLLFGCRQALAQSPIISNLDANRCGLTRSWFTQVDLDRAHSRIAYVTQHRGTLFVQTTRSIVHAVDAETGATLWSAQIGRPEHPSLAPAANDKYVAVVNGSRLYVVERATGNFLWDRSVVGGAPGAGPALTKERAFIPMINGRIEAYELENNKQPPWIYSSAGRALVQPIVSAGSVFWPTDRGHLYVARAVNPAVRFRIETNDAIVSAPAYQKPYLFAASRDGYVYAVHEMSGTQLWRFSAGDPISESPVVIGERVFVCPEYGGMFCVSAKTGVEQWWAPRGAKFLAASEKYVYGTDKLGRLFVLNIENGARLGVMRMYGQNLLLANSQTDRVYVGTDTGFLQCLHDSTQSEPLQYTLPESGEDETSPEAGKSEEKAAPKSKEKAEEGDNPFANVEKEKPAEGGNPFEGAAPAAKPAAADNENPFGGGTDNPEMKKEDGAGAKDNDDNPFN